MGFIVITDICSVYSDERRFTIDSNNENLIKQEIFSAHKNTFKTLNNK